jgi:hypothetical protein
MFMIVVDDDAAPPEDQQTVDAEIKALLVSSSRVQDKVWRRYKLISASQIGKDSPSLYCRHNESLQGNWFSHSIKSV